MGTIRDLCRGEVIGINVDAPIESAASLMKEKSVGFLIISALNGNPVGVVTDRDIVCRGVHAGLDLSKEPVRMIMTSPYIAVTEWADLNQALKLMALHEIRRLVVTDIQGNFVGVVSADDILRRIVSEMNQLAALYFSQTSFSKAAHSPDYTQMA